MKNSFNVASFTSKQAPSALIQNNGEFQAVLLSFSFLVFPVLRSSIKGKSYYTFKSNIHILEFKSF